MTRVRGIYGGTVTEDQARKEWTRCDYYGGTFRIEGDRILYAVVGPARRDGAAGFGVAERTYDVTKGMAEGDLIEEEVLVPA